MERTIGVDKARAKLGEIADEIAADDDAVVLTRRGQPVAVLVSPSEYDSLVESRRRMARAPLSAMRATTASWRPPPRGPLTTSSPATITCSGLAASNASPSWRPASSLRLSSAEQQLADEQTVPESRSSGVGTCA